MTNLPTRHNDQQARLFDELKLALSRTTSEDMKSWGTASAARLPAIGKRRIRNFGTMISSIAKAAGREIQSAVNAAKDGQFGSHLGQRTAAGIDGTIDLGKQVWNVLGAVGSAVADDPKKNAPGVLALALGFIAGSGGADGNGGIPDTDIAMFGLVTTDPSLPIPSSLASSSKDRSWLWLIWPGSSATNFRSARGPNFGTS